MLFATAPTHPGELQSPHAALPEVDLTHLAGDALQSGKRLCIPRVDWAAKSLTPVWIKRWPEDLIESKFGVAEPRNDLPAARLEDIDLVLTPGLGFDHAGNRIGRGGGFYDRFLSSPMLRASTCGVCFLEQLIPTPLLLPTDPWDRPVAIVVTSNDTLVMPAREH